MGIYLAIQLLLFISFHGNRAEGFFLQVSSLIFILLIFLSLPVVKFFQVKKFSEKKKELLMEGIPLLFQYDILALFLYFFLRQTPWESVGASSWDGGLAQAMPQISGIFFLLAGIQTLLLFMHSYERIKRKTGKERIIWSFLILLPAFIIYSLMLYLIFDRPTSGG